MKYRIRTQKEFLAEFGPNWRSIVEFSFPSHMDPLLGKRLSKEESVVFKRDESFNTAIGTERYGISKDMVVKYNDRFELHKQRLMTTSL